MPLALKARFYFRKAAVILASHAGVFRRARVSSLPTNARSTENNNSFLIVPEFGKYNVIG